MNIYLIGSLRNTRIPTIGQEVRAAGFEVFDDWYAAGPAADDSWRDYERARGRTYLQALSGYAATHVFEFDRHHLDRSDAGILVLPAGRSGFMELGYLAGRGRQTYILLDNPERWDVMLKLATGVYTDLKEIIERLQYDNNLSRSALAGTGAGTSCQRFFRLVRDWCQQPMARLRG